MYLYELKYTQVYWCTWKITLVTDKCIICMPENALKFLMRLKNSLLIL